MVSRTVLPLLLLCLLTAARPVANKEDCEVNGSCVGGRYHPRDEFSGVECLDMHKFCGDWKRDGECNTNPHFMLQYCRISCGSCSYTDEDIIKMVAQVETPYGVDQERDKEGRVDAMIAEYAPYMDNLILKDPNYASIKDDCKNFHKNCAYWRSLGECERNSLWMNEHCGPACEVCHLLITKRGKKAWHGGLQQTESYFKLSK